MLAAPAITKANAREMQQRATASRLRNIAARKAAMRAEEQLSTPAQARLSRLWGMLADLDRRMMHAPSERLPDLATAAKLLQAQALELQGKPSKAAPPISAPRVLPEPEPISGQECESSP